MEFGLCTVLVHSDVQADTATLLEHTMLVEVDVVKLGRRARSDDWDEANWGLSNRPVRVGNFV